MSDDDDFMQDSGDEEYATNILHATSSVLAN
jgi:hypothetical protein